ncbi:universal stress protein [Evansella clarkii]|uniref:universal stress protein n=1 Tax=Evansella clarkii TaxID=79879 RepID=UPI000B444075|nr:universal stress protein [Evansella clarkii]
MIIVPVDGSSHALKAVETAVEMAEKYTEPLLMLNVQPEKEKLFSGEDPGDERWLAEKEAKGQEVMKSAAELVNERVPYEQKVRIGTPSIQITDEAAEQKARCIVMGSRGSGPFVSAILGSVSYGVLHLAQCPVMVVPDDMN